MSDDADNFNGVEILRNVTPNWLADGKGIRGDAEVLASGAAEMSWPRASIQGVDNNEQVPEAGLSGGGGAPEQKSYLAFQMVDASDQNGPRIRIVSGFVANKIPPGMTSGDDPPYTVSVSGPGSAYVGVTISIATGEVTSVMVGVGAIPADSSTNYYFSLGSFNVVGGVVTVSSNRGGNVGVSVCRKWYVGEKEKGYNVIFSQ